MRVLDKQTNGRGSVPAPGAADEADDTFVCRALEATLDASCLRVAGADHQRLLDSFRLLDVVAIGPAGGAQAGSGNEARGGGERGAAPVEAEKAASLSATAAVPYIRCASRACGAC